MVLLRERAHNIFGSLEQDLNQWTDDYKCCGMPTKLSSPQLGCYHFKLYHFNHIIYHMWHADECTCNVLTNNACTHHCISQHGHNIYIIQCQKMNIVSIFQKRWKSLALHFLIESLISKKSFCKGTGDLVNNLKALKAIYPYYISPRLTWNMQLRLWCKQNEISKD